MKITKLQLNLSSTIKFGIIGFILITLTIKSSAQNAFLSFQVSRDASGSGLGGNICPALMFTNNQSTFIIGPNFQRKRMNYSGMQSSYRYSVAKNYNNKKELFIVGSLLVHSSARMADSYIEIEKSGNSENTYNYHVLRFKVIESYAGIGFKINPTKNFNTLISVEMGGFNTLDKNYNKEMYREKASVAMRLNFSLVYNFKQTVK